MLNFVYDVNFFLCVIGIGYSCIQLVIAVSIQRHVVTSRIGLANGIIMAGQGLGVVLWSPLQQYWIETYGWTKATIFEAVIMLPVFVVIYIIHLADKTEDAKNEQILKDNEQCEEDVQNDNVYGTVSSGEKLELETNGCSEFSQDEKLADTKSTSLKNSDTIQGISNFSKQIKEIIAPLMLMRKYPAFIMYCCALFPAHTAHIAVYFILPARGIQVGETSQQAAFMVSIIGAITVVGRIGFGAISDTTYLSKQRTALVAISFIVNGLVAMACGFLPYSWALICYSVVFGSTSGRYYVKLCDMASHISVYSDLAYFFSTVCRSAEYTLCITDVSRPYHCCIGCDVCGYGHGLVYRIYSRRYVCFYPSGRYL